MQQVFEMLQVSKEHSLRGDRRSGLRPFLSSPFHPYSLFFFYCIRYLQGRSISISSSFYTQVVFHFSNLSSSFCFPYNERRAQEFQGPTGFNDSKLIENHRIVPTFPPSSRPLCVHKCKFSICLLFLFFLFFLQRFKQIFSSR